jgi:hypothetical protein
VAGVDGHAVQPEGDRLLVRPGRRGRGGGASVGGEISSGKWRGGQRLNMLQVADSEAAAAADQIASLR